METSFCELRKKMVINMVDGSCLGHICDIIIDPNCAKISGLVVPCGRSFLSFLGSKKDIFIPNNNICRIGTDVILVEVYINPTECDRGGSCNKLGTNH